LSGTPPGLQAIPNGAIRERRIRIVKGSFSIYHAPLGSGEQARDALRLFRQRANRRVQPWTREPG
jgi:hypothetical protein